MLDISLKDVLDAIGDYYDDDLDLSLDLVDLDCLDGGDDL